MSGSRGTSRSEIRAPLGTPRYNCYGRPASSLSPGQRQDGHLERDSGVIEEHLISVVDDDPEARDGVTELVETLGFQVRAFASGEDFLRSGFARATGCLVVDMHMKGMSGLELFRLLTGGGLRIPTIMITGHPSEKTKGEAIRAGILCYLPKPFSENDFVAAIETALGQGPTRGHPPTI